MNTQQNIAMSDIAALKISAPPVAAQHVIADYLDRETARIDALIAAKRRLIELLEELREASSAEAIHAAMDSYPLVPLWAVLQPVEVTGFPHYELLSVYREHGVVPKSSRSDNFNKAPTDLSRYQVVNAGDVVVNKMKAWQGSIAVAFVDGIVSPDYLVCRMRTPIDMAYLHHILRSPQMRAEYEKRSEGIRPNQWRLQWDQMRQIRIPIPPTSAQVAVVAKHEATVARSRGLDVALTRQIGLLQEHRQALITAAVTGELDFAEAA